MKPTKKQIVYGVVLAGSSALLVAQVLERRSRPKPPATIERGALDDATAASGELVAGELAAGVIVTIDGAPRSESPRTDEPEPARAESEAVDLPPEDDPASVLDRLEASLAGLHNITPGARRPNLDRLARGWAKERVEPAPLPELASTLFAPAPSAPEASASDASAADGASGAELPSADALTRFLTDNPLCGIVAGTQDAAAMFGGRIVRAGDQLVPGDAIVQAIERRAVLVTYRRRDVRVELPAFRPRPRPDFGPANSASEAVGASAGAAAAPAEPGTTAAAKSTAADAAESAATATTESKDATKQD